MAFDVGGSQFTRRHDAGQRPTCSDRDAERDAVAQSRRLAAQVEVSLDNSLYRARFAGVPERAKRLLTPEVPGGVLDASVLVTPLPA